MSITHFHDNELTEELRLTSDYNEPVNFMAGAFYQEGQQRQELQLPGNILLGLPEMVQSVLNIVDIDAISFSVK